MLEVGWCGTASRIAFLRKDGDFCSARLVSSETNVAVELTPVDFLPPIPFFSMRSWQPLPCIVVVVSQRQRDEGRIGWRIPRIW